VAGQSVASDLQGRGFIIRDSGQRQAFAGGAVRDTHGDKPRPDLISPFFLNRLGAWLALGAHKYGERNWEKGIPSSRCLASLWRHLLAWQRGEADEDHLSAAAFNLMAIIHNEETTRQGLLAPQFHDPPLPTKEDNHA